MTVWGNTEKIEILIFRGSKEILLVNLSKKKNKTKQNKTKQKHNTDCKVQKKKTLNVVK